MPLRNAFKGAIIDKLQMDREWRDYAFGALAIVEKNPMITVKFSDGSQCQLPFQDIYCQVYCRDQINLEERIMTGIAWQHILLGEYIYVVYQVRETPKPDADIQGNNEILQDMVHRYRSVFASAEFWGGTQGADGQITFKKAAIKDFWGVEVAQEIGFDVSKVVGPRRGRCQYFPLEVGFCHPDQIQTHFFNSNCVARFPYGHDLVIFLEDLTDWDARIVDIFGSDKTLHSNLQLEITGQLTLPW